MRLLRVMPLRSTLLVVCALVVVVLVSSGCLNTSTTSDGDVKQVQSDLRAALGPRLQTVEFEADTAKLSDKEQAELSEVASALIVNNGAPITITGDLGTLDTINSRLLSEMRAQSVHDYLVGFGVAPLMMTTGVADEGDVAAARIRVPGGQGQTSYRRWDETGEVGLDQFDFSGAPDYQAALPSMVSPIDACDMCMSELTAHLVPPRSGKYRFWVSADDEAALDISPDAAFENLVQLTRLEPGQWTKRLEFERYPQQRTRLVTLEAGRRYAIRARAHEGAAGDHLIVYWTPPGGKRQRIPEDALRAAR